MEEILYCNISGRFRPQNPRVADCCNAGVLVAAIGSRRWIVEEFRIDSRLHPLFSNIEFGCFELDFDSKVSWNYRLMH